MTKSGEGPRPQADYARMTITSQQVKAARGCYASGPASTWGVVQCLTR
jgi:hypothetical protein